MAEQQPTATTPVEVVKDVSATTPLEELGKIEVVDDDAAAGEQAVTQAPKKGVPLAPEVHAAVREERERTRRYREILEQTYILDPQGQVVSIRPEVEQWMRQTYGAQPQPAQAPTDQTAVWKQRVQEYADQVGLLPEQVEAVISLAQAIADQRVREETGVLYQSSAEQLKANLISNPIVPREAASYVAQVMDQAFQINPKAAMSREGQEVVLNQALGAWFRHAYGAYRGRQGPRAPSPVAPTMLRPSNSPTGPQTMTPEEMLIRKKLGLK